MRKQVMPKCIVCGKDKITPTYPENMKLVRKRFRYTPIKMYNHFNTSNGVVAYIEPGYGSKFDGDEIVIGICDDCLTEAIEWKSVLHEERKW